MKRPILCALGVSHRDAKLAAVWFRWVNFLCAQPGGDNSENVLLIVYAQRAWPMDPIYSAMRGTLYGEFKTTIIRCHDEEEAGHPKSASHLFLRTLEIAEKQFPGYAVLWCEADAVPLRPTWFREIADEYESCGKAFMGQKIGDKKPHMSGVAVYPADWRVRMPSVLTVLDAKDNDLWGPGKGQAWDVHCRNDTLRDFHETGLINHRWKNRDMRATALADVPRAACLFHQDKTGALIRELTQTRYPDFMATTSEPRRFYLLNGHPSRLRAKGHAIHFSYSRYLNHGWKSAVCSMELTEGDASAMSLMVGKLGIEEISEAQFFQLTGRTRETVPDVRRAKLAAPQVAVSHPSVFVMLGRYGDIFGILPMLHAEHNAGRKPTLVVSAEFADLLDGVSYVERIVWDGPYEAVPECLRWLRRTHSIHMPVVAQYHKNPLDKARLTPSYQMEQWRLAGKLEEFENRVPLVFDRRDEARETELVRMVDNGVKEKPLILVGLKSVSSPLANSDSIMRALVERFGDEYEVVDLSKIKAERIYDLIGLFDFAKLLVTADTAFFHLARASTVKVVALLNAGWRGSVADF